jgi:hypothetical protein
MWLTGRLVPDHKTIADFRKDNGLAIREVCAQFVALCREIGLLTTASVAIDGSKFKAVNNRDKTRCGLWRAREATAATRFRTLQARPKDRRSGHWQAGRCGKPPACGSCLSVA